jgi:thymidylate synthase
MWILYGETDSNLLKERCGVNVWEGNTTREFLDSRGLHWLPEGDIGASYGYQMRKFGSSDITKNKTIEDKSKVNEGFDQLKECIRLIKEEPNSNRIIINLWNPLQLDMMSLPPCGFCYQFDVEDFEGIKRLNCKVTQRSSDVLLAGGWNITSASLFTILLSRECGIYPGRVIWSPGNVHIYENNIKEAKEIIKNFVDENTTLFHFPLLKLTEKSLFDYTFSDLNIINYQYYPKINLNFNV